MTKSSFLEAMELLLRTKAPYIGHLKGGIHRGTFVLVTNETIRVPIPCPEDEDQLAAHASRLAPVLQLALYIARKKRRSHILAFDVTERMALEVLGRGSGLIDTMDSEAALVDAMSSDKGDPAAESIRRATIPVR